MQIRIDGIDYSYPATLMDITLEERIAFDNLHGIALRKQLSEILAMKSDTDRDIEFVIYHCDLAKATLSFFANVPSRIVEQVAIEDVMVIYHELLHSYSDDVDFALNCELKKEFMWQGEAWEIQPPQLEQSSEMIFGEFVDAKQSVQDFFENGNEKFSALLALCCVYFRKKGEKYIKDLRVENGERWQLLKNLPLPYALHVGFFLNGCRHTYKTPFPYSGRRVPKVQADMYQTT